MLAPTMPLVRQPSIDSDELDALLSSEGDHPLLLQQSDDQFKVTDRIRSLRRKMWKGAVAAVLGDRRSAVRLVCALESDPKAFESHPNPMVASLASLAATVVEDFAILHRLRLEHGSRAQYEWVSVGLRLLGELPTSASAEPTIFNLPPVIPDDATAVLVHIEVCIRKRLVERQESWQVSTTWAETDDLVSRSFPVYITLGGATDDVASFASVSAWLPLDPQLPSTGGDHHDDDDDDDDDDDRHVLAASPLASHGGKVVHPADLSRRSVLISKGPMGTFTGGTGRVFAIGYRR